jgi:hypothetical protein
MTRSTSCGTDRARAVDVGIMLAIVQIAILWLLVRQMEWGSGASMAVKVSYMTIAIQAAMDCYYFVRPIHLRSLKVVSPSQSIHCLPLGPCH